MNNKLESTNHSKKHMSKRDDPPKLALEVEESVDLSTRVSMIVVMISAVIAGFGLAALLVLPTQKAKTTPSVKVTAQKPVAAERIAKGLFMPDQILVKFKLGVKDQVKDNTIKAVLDTPIKAMVDKSTGRVIQSYFPENSIAASELKEIKTSLKQRQKIIKNKTSLAEKSGLDRWELLSVSETDINQLVNKFKNDSNIEYAEPNFIGEATLSPSDTFYQPTEKLGVCGSGSGFFIGSRCYQDSNCILRGSLCNEEAKCNSGPFIGSECDQDSDCILPGSLCLKETNTIQVQWGAPKVNTERAWDVIYAKRGDLDHDNDIDNDDLNFLKNYLNHGGPAPEPIEIGDVNGDDKVSNADLLYLGKYIQVPPQGPAPVDYSKNIVKVAVIDSGIDYNHPDISDNVWVFPGEIEGNDIDDDGNGYIDDVRGWDFTTCKEFDSNGCKFGQTKLPGNDVMDYMSSCGHGTHVAGLVSSRLNNSLGLASLGGGWYPEKAGIKVMAVKALNKQGKLLVSELSMAIDYAADQGAKVINLSLAINSYSQLLADHILYAQNQGSLIVAAAGNFKTEALLFSPGNLPGVLAVAASDENDLIWREASSDGSNSGANISVAAPGKDIISLKSSYVITGKNIVADNYFLLTGTSQAAPQVSALAALIWAKHPEFTSEQVKSAIKMGADDIVNPLGGTENLAGWDPYAGQGRINAYKSLKILNPLISQINSPSNFDNYTLGDSITITGSTGGINFQSYQVEYIKENMTGSWTQIFTSNSPVTNGILATWSTSGLDGGSYYLRVTTADTSGNILSDHKIINISHPFQAGNWSAKQIDNWMWSSLTFADLDSNSSNGLEIMFPSQKLTPPSDEYEVFAWHHDGSDVSGNWPVDGGTSGYIKSVSVADLDQDGDKEAIAISSDWTTAYVWQADGTLNNEWNWPVLDRYKSSFSAPAIADLEGDGDLEIVFNQWYVKSWNAEIIAYHHDGSPVWGQPITVFGSLSSTPAIADLDNDGDKEIIIANAVGASRPGKIYVYHHYADPMDGWPQDAGTGGTYSSPVIADLDGDANGDLEIVIGGYDNKVYAYHHNGALMSGWPVLTNDRIISSPAIADLDSSYPGLEIIIGSDDRYVYAWHADGSSVPGWPKETGGEVTSSPIVADLDGNGDLEIAVGSEDGKFYVWHHDGSNVNGFPVTTTASISSSPAVGDLDNDGHLEIGVVNQAGRIYLWDLSRWLAGNNKLSWPMFHHDLRSTGLYNQCSDYTQWGQCNPITKQYCNNGMLENCPVAKPYCNPTNFACEAKCSDGTPFGQCNNASKQYCDNGNLKYWCTRCTYTCPTNKPFCMTNGDCVVCQQNSDCNDNVVCTNDICNSPGTTSSSCSRINTCPSTQPYCNRTNGLCEKKCADGTLFGQCNGRYLYCSAGTLYKWCMSCGCPGGGTCKKTSGGGTCIGGTTDTPAAY